MQSLIQIQSLVWACIANRETDREFYIYILLYHNYVFTCSIATYLRNTNLCFNVYFLIKNPLGGCWSINTCFKCTRAWKYKQMQFFVSLESRSGLKVQVLGASELESGWNYYVLRDIFSVAIVLALLELIDKTIPTAEKLALLIIIIPLENAGPLHYTP